MSLELDVPAGVTLTVAHGTIVKSEAGFIQVEGALDAVGTTASPIIFTSVNDNTVGGTTGSGNPAAGDWSGIDVRVQGTIDLEQADVDYASTAMAFSSSGSGLLQDVDIMSVGTALSVSNGTITFRGEISKVSMGVEACDWGVGTCFVDAAYSYWGSSVGPVPDSGPSLVCGAVTISPFYTSPDGTTTASGPLFGDGNCDNAVTPDDQLSASVQNFNQAVAEDEIDCGDGFETFCQEAQLDQNCLDAAVQLAAENSPIPLDANSLESQTASETVDGLAGYLAESESVALAAFGDVAKFADDIGIPVGVITIELAQAYSRCSN